MNNLTKFSDSTPVRRPSAVNPDENSYKPHLLWKYSYQFKTQCKDDLMISDI